MAFERWTIAAILLMAQMHGAIAQSANYPCPCEYKAPQYPELTSRRPIPAAHLACLRYIHETVLAFGRFMGESQGEKARNYHQDVLDRRLKRDWGVPTAAAARDLIRDSETVRAEDTEKLRKEEKISDPSQTVRDNISFSKGMVLLANNNIDYANCVIKNGLPPTVP